MTDNHQAVNQAAEKVRSTAVPAIRNVLGALQNAIQAADKDIDNIASALVDLASAQAGPPHPGSK